MVYCVLGLFILNIFWFCCISLKNCFLRRCCLIFTTFCLFKFPSVIDFQFYSIVVKELMTMVWFQSFYVYWYLSYVSVKAFDLTRRIFHIHLRRKCILLFLSRVFSPVGIVSLECFTSLLFNCRFFSLLFYLLLKVEYLKSPTIIVQLSISPSILSVVASYILVLYC